MKDHLSFTTISERQNGIDSMNIQKNPIVHIPSSTNLLAPHCISNMRKHIARAQQTYFLSPEEYLALNPFLEVSIRELANDARESFYVTIGTNGGKSMD